MKINYLTWIHYLANQIQGRPDCYNLLYSNVQTPTELLAKHVANYCSNDFRQLLEPATQINLSDRIADCYGTQNDRVLVTSSASQAMVMVFQTLLRKGDHVIIEHPVYEPLLAMPDFLETRVSLLRRRAEEEYQISLDELDALMTPQTKLIVLTNLHNPSSAFLSEESLRDLLTVTQQYHDQVHIVIDEVYHDFIKDWQPPAALLHDAFISINSLSKVYGLSFLRCGWIMANPAVLEKVRRVGILTANFGSHLTETLASLVFANIEEYDRYWLTLTSRNRNIVQDVLSPLLENGKLIGKIPTVGCMFFPQVANMNDTRQFTQALANRHQVFVVPGDFFGSPDCVRIGFGRNSEELQIGLEKLATAVVSGG